jgi:hypothetical protein
MKERKLSGRAIEELCRQLYALPVVYRPRTDAERKRLDNLMATGTGVAFALRDDEEERKQYADLMAAAAADRVRKQLLNPPSEESQLNQQVWLVLKLLLGEPLDGEGGRDIADRVGELPMLQSEKLHYRWWLVAGLHKKGLTWERAYDVASYMSKGCDSGPPMPWAGTELTMKHAYVTVQRIRRTLKRERERREREAKARCASKPPALA